ncbi:MAG TPA: sialidase family protein [Chthoniobacteraceae bacterium]|nr:sialidase family protein [Chthoniobacteraceae bacterium]
MSEHGGFVRALAQNFTTVATVPEGDENSYPLFYSNGFALLPGGRFVAVGNRVRRLRSGKGPIADGIVVARSGDHGETWETVCFLPFQEVVESALFVYEGTLYMLVGPRTHRGKVWILASGDEGKNWTQPIEIITAADGGETPTWYCLHQTQMAVWDGKLYFSVSEICQKPAVICCDLAKGPLHAAAWRISQLVEMPIPKELNPGLFPGPSNRCLEGNVIRINGKLRVLSRAIIDRQGTANMAAVFDLTDEQGELNFAFTQLSALPGGQCKFYIIYDEPSKLFWMASNIAANTQGWVEDPYPFKHPPGVSDRRFLMLWYACDALNWFPAGCIAAAEKLTQSFMYPSVHVDGEDLAILSRSSLNSGHHHDADCLTFHRVRNFRSLAMNIWPKV